MCVELCCQVCFFVLRPIQGDWFKNKRKQIDCTKGLFLLIIKKIEIVRNKTHFLIDKSSIYFPCCWLSWILNLKTKIFLKQKYIASKNHFYKSFLWFLCFMINCCWSFCGLYIWSQGCGQVCAGFRRPEMLPVAARVQRTGR